MRDKSAIPDDTSPTPSAEKQPPALPSPEERARLLGESLARGMAEAAKTGKAYR